MSKAIKVIDLLNKIANGEEVPKKIRFEKTIFKYDKERKDYIHNIEDDGLVFETLLYRVMGPYFIEELINNTVEIIEEEPGIDIQGIEGTEVEVISQCDNWLQDKNEEITAEINPYIIDCIRKNTLNFNNKINELIKAIKQLDNQINNK